MGAGCARVAISAILHLMHNTDITAARPLTKQDYKTLSLAALGGALEFYDFIIFVFHMANQATLPDPTSYMAPLQRPVRKSDRASPLIPMSTVPWITSEYLPVNTQIDAGKVRWLIPSTNAPRVDGCMVAPASRVPLDALTRGGRSSLVDFNSAC